MVRVARVRELENAWAAFIPFLFDSEFAFNEKRKAKKIGFLPEFTVVDRRFGGRNWFYLTEN